MRVLDAGSTHTYKMGKNRKHRIRKSKENEAEESSDDGVALCPHIPKAINYAAMRKTLLKPTCTFGECTGCMGEASRVGAKDLFGSPLEGAAACAADDSDQDPSVWVCLQCGHQGCDRNSRDKHALKHFECPHTGVHCIVANLTSWTSWCYTCNADIPVESSKRILECIDFLRKQAGLPRLELSHFTGQRVAQTTSHSDISPTDPSPPISQSRTDKVQVTTRSAVVACQKVKGLNNLGNTCFFNAVMQNLCQTHSLEALLLSSCKKGRSMTIGTLRDTHTDSDSSGEGEEEEEPKHKDLPMIDIVPGDPGPLTQSLLSFVQEMNNGTAHGAITPNTLFTHICKKAPRFKGFQQQDSHELLRYLLDVVRSEEIKRSQIGILKHFKLPESVNPKKVDEETKTRIREYGRQVKYTFLDSLFGGQLVSTITCEDCKHISQIFEPFLDLSLPVTEEKPQRPNQLAAARRKDSGAATIASASGGGEGQGAEEAPSGGLERKNCHQTRKEAKRKGRLTQVGLCQAKSMEVGEEDRERGMKGSERGMGGMTGTAEPDSSSNNTNMDGEDDHSSAHEEDPSDADVEDNIDNEMSILHQPSTPHYQGLPCHPPETTTRTIPYTITTTTTTIPSTFTFTTTTTTTIPSIANSTTILSTFTTITVPSTTTTITAPSTTITNTTTTTIPFIITSTTPSITTFSITKTTTTTISSITTLTSPSTTIASSMDHQIPHESNLRHRKSCESDAPLHMKVGVIKEKHLLPGDLSPAGDWQQCYMGSLRGEGVDTLTNGMGKMDLNLTHRGGKTVGPQCNHVGLYRNDSITVMNHVDSKPESSSSELHVSIQDTALESVRKGESGKDCSLTTDCAAELDKYGAVEDRGTETGVGGGGGFSNANGDKKAVNHPAKLLRQQLRRDARYKLKMTLAPRYQCQPKECSVMSCLHQFTAAELLTGTNKVACKNCTRLRPKNATPHKDKKGADMVYSSAAKQFLILVPPAVLTLHLKRFEQVGYTCRKVNRQVDFPVVLDLAPYCSTLCQDIRSGQRRLLYSLYGLVEHSGRLQGGHYTAYVKVRPSLGPLTSFLNTTQSCNPRDYIRRFMEQLASSSSSSSHPSEEELSEQSAMESLMPPGRWFHVSDSRINEVTEATVLRAQAYLLFYERVY